MRRRSRMLKTILAVGVFAAAMPLARGGAAAEPAEDFEQNAALPPNNGHVALATGGYQFTIPPGWNGNIFANTLPIENRLTFNAKKDLDGSVSGWYDYQQTYEGVVYKFSGPVTCLGVIDTPVLVQTPEVPALTHNRAKWGGRVDQSSDPTVPVGTFIWFASMDNGEGANGWSDSSTLPSFGSERINNLFCASTRVPNPNTGPHRVGGGNIQVH
ncbi:MAG: hypothetical protein HY049_08575 [Acidobacteria bacterium]|nr:hypothetical protein [Acidobacteriota bacterium]